MNIMDTGRAFQSVQRRLWQWVDILRPKGCLRLPPPVQFPPRRPRSDCPPGFTQIEPEAGLDVLVTSSPTAQRAVAVFSDNFQLCGGRRFPNYLGPPWVNMPLGDGVGYTADVVDDALGILWWSPGDYSVLDRARVYVDRHRGDRMPVDVWRLYCKRAWKHAQGVAHYFKELRGAVVQHGGGNPDQWHRIEMMLQREKEAQSALPRSDRLP